jgi:hypothetical protein
MAPRSVAIHVGALAHNALGLADAFDDALAQALLVGKAITSYLRETIRS